MDDQLLNDIASLEADSLTEGEREVVLSKLVEDPVASLLLRSLPEPSEPTEPSKGILPFPVTRKVRVGICEGFLRIFNLHGLQLCGGVRKCMFFLAEIGGDRLPLCLKRDLSLEFDFAHVKGSLAIVVPDESDKASLSVRIEASSRHRDYIEIWENGVLLVAHKANRSVVTVPVGGSTTLAIRHTSSPFGVGIRVAPILFEGIDWLAACMLSAVEGGFSQAVDLLSKLTKTDQPITDVLSKAGSYLEMLRGLMKVEGFILTPVPATRGTHSNETYQQVFSGVWDGVVACWPECKQLERSIGECPLSSGSFESIDPHVWRLVKTVREAMAGKPPVVPPDLETYNSLLVEGWKATLAFQHLISGNPTDALWMLESIEPSSGDLFGIYRARTLARHLLVCQTSGKASEAVELSTKQLWKNVFQPVLSLYSDKEDSPWRSP